MLSHLQWRLLLLLILLVVGGWLFRVLEPENGLGILESMYYTWSLIFGEPPEAFPESFILQMLFFVVPILGLTVIIEALIDLALMARDRQRCEPRWCRIMAKSLSNHVILIGLGRLGIRTYRLLREMGITVVVIEKDAANQFLDEIRRDGVPLFVGDARDESYLVAANVEKATSVVIASSDDLANLECALDARRLAPGIRVVMRMFDQNMADKVREGFNISFAMSPAAISAPAFATCAIEPATVSSFLVEDQLIVMQRWLVTRRDPLCGRTVGELNRQFSINVMNRRPVGAEAILFPEPDVRLESGDRLVIQGPYEAMEALWGQLRAIIDARESG